MESLSASTSTGISSLSTGLSSVSASTSTGISSLSTGMNSLSSSTSTGNATDKLRLTNVADGIDNNDVATVGQLKATGMYGPGAKTAVTYDSNADGSVNYSSITLGNGTQDTVIHDVAAGSAPTDLINKAQLDALQSSVQNATVSANPMFAADGDRTAEAAVASGPHSVASGANAQALSMSSVANGANSVARGNYAAAIGANSQADADNSVALGASSVSDRAQTVSVGAAGSERQITNVAAGTQDTDMVNVNQLNDAVSSANSYTDQQVGAMQGAVDGVARNAYSGIAAATAMAMVPNIDQDKTMSVGVGGASYQGYAAAAVAVNLRVTQNLVLKAGAGTSRNGTVYGANASYRW
ncbi:YadA-like family protein [Caballeronia sp. ATUFL_M2_KS44]|uniref:YadA family autotransporter adhesin n=1 Tax=Caballeronia sp. ATUFL_M2_KS44 TaxID=2921767 RepID=UPI0032ED8ACA